MELGPTIIQGPYNPDDCLNCLGDEPRFLPGSGVRQPSFVTNLPYLLSNPIVLGGAIGGALLLKNHRLIGALLGAAAAFYIGPRIFGQAGAY